MGDLGANQRPSLFEVGECEVLGTIGRNERREEERCSDPVAGSPEPTSWSRPSCAARRVVYRRVGLPGVPP